MMGNSMSASPQMGQRRQRTPSPLKYPGTPTIAERIEALESAQRRHSGNKAPTGGAPLVMPQHSPWHRELLPQMHNGTPDQKTPAPDSDMHSIPTIEWPDSSSWTRFQSEEMCGGSSELEKENSPDKIPHGRQRNDLRKSPQQSLQIPSLDHRKGMTEVHEPVSSVNHRISQFLTKVSHTSQPSQYSDDEEEGILDSVIKKTQNMRHRTKSPELAALNIRQVASAGRLPINIIDSILASTREQNVERSDVSDHQEALRRLLTEESQPVSEEPESRDDEPRISKQHSPGSRARGFDPLVQRQERPGAFPPEFYDFQATTNPFAARTSEAYGAQLHQLFLSPDQRHNNSRASPSQSHVGFSSAQQPPSRDLASQNYMTPDADIAHNWYQALSKETQFMLNSGPSREAETALPLTKSSQTASIDQKAASNDSSMNVNMSFSPLRTDRRPTIAEQFAHRPPFSDFAPRERNFSGHPYFGNRGGTGRLGIEQRVDVFESSWMQRGYETSSLLESTTTTEHTNTNSAQPGSPASRSSFPTMEGSGRFNLEAMEAVFGSNFISQRQLWQSDQRQSETLRDTRLPFQEAHLYSLAAESFGNHHPQNLQASSRPYVPRYHILPHHVEPVDQSTDSHSLRPPLATTASSCARETAEIDRLLMLLDPMISTGTSHAELRTSRGIGRDPHRFLQEDLSDTGFSQMLKNEAFAEMDVDEVIELSQMIRKSTTPKASGSDPPWSSRKEVETTHRFRRSKDPPNDDPPRRIGTTKKEPEGFGLRRPSAPDKESLHIDEVSTIVASDVFENVVDFRKEELSYADTKVSGLTNTPSVSFSTPQPIAPYIDRPLSTPVTSNTMLSIPGSENGTSVHSMHALHNGQSTNLSFSLSSSLRTSMTPPGIVAQSSESVIVGTKPSWNLRPQPESRLKVGPRGVQLVTCQGHNDKPERTNRTRKYLESFTGVKTMGSFDSVSLINEEDGVVTKTRPNPIRGVFKQTTLDAEDKSSKTRPNPIPGVFKPSVLDAEDKSSKRKSTKVDHAQPQKGISRTNVASRSSEPPPVWSKQFLGPNMADQVLYVMGPLLSGDTDDTSVDDEGKPQEQPPKGCSLFMCGDTDWLSGLPRWC